MDGVQIEDRVRIIRKKSEGLQTLEKWPQKLLHFQNRTYAVYANKTLVKGAVPVSETAKRAPRGAKQSCNSWLNCDWASLLLAWKLRRHHVDSHQPTSSSTVRRSSWHEVLFRKKKRWIEGKSKEGKLKFCSWFRFLQAKLSPSSRT